MSAIIDELRAEATCLAAERQAFMGFKRGKAQAEDELLMVIVEAARPVFAALSSKITEGSRGIFLGGQLHLSEEGMFFELKSSGYTSPLTIGEVLECTTPAAILAVLIAAIRAQRGKLDPRMAEIRRETGILEGIAAAFKVGGCK